MQETLPRVFLFGVPLICATLKQVTQLILARLESGLGGYVCIANVHAVMESLDHSSLKEAYLNAWINTADGMPLVWYSKLRKTDPLIPERVCGPDLAQWFFDNQKSLPMGFIGGREGQAESIVRRYGLLHSVLYSPPLRAFSPENAIEDWSHFLDQSKASQLRPRLVWVGLGAPKQEQWMQAVSKVAPDVVFIGVGAAFDFHSGRIERAPHWMQTSGLEWVFRLSQDPARLWKRYLKTNSRFLFEIFRSF